MDIILSKFGLSRNQIKWIALVLMICDHIGAIFVDPSTNLYFILRFVLGRSSYPLFCVLFIEGFFYTKRPWRHVLDFLIFGVISEFTYDLAFENHCLFDWSQQNVMFSWMLGFLLCIILKFLYDTIDVSNETLDSDISHGSIYAAMVGVILLFSVLAYETKVDYSYVGILVTGVMFFAKIFKKNIKAWQLGVLVSVIDGICLMTIWTFPAVFILMLYNSNKVCNYKHKTFVKYFFYSMYPLHLGLLALCYFIL